MSTTEPSVTRDHELTAKAADFYPFGLIAREVFPEVHSEELRDQYFSYVGDRRGKWLTFQIQEFALEFTLRDDEAYDGAEDEQAVEARKATRLHRVLTKIYTDREFRIANLLRDPANYSTGHHVVVTGVRQWDKLTYNLAGSDHLLFCETIDLGVDAIRNHTGGLLPNTIILAHPAADAFRNWVARTPDNAYDDKPGLLHPKHLRIVEGMALFSRDPSNGMEWVWGNDAILAYIEPHPYRDSLTLGMTFTSRPPIVKRYRDEMKLETIYRVSTVSDERLVAPDCGFLIRNVVKS